MTDLWVEETRPCRDEECPGSADPEQDGDTRYWACTLCGMEFGFERTPQPVQDACAIGVAPEVRQRFSSPADGRPAPVPISIGRRPDA